MKNMQIYAVREGLNVNVKDKTNWFDRNIVNMFDKLRIKWNEALADRNSSRAEGQLQNARAYQSGAEQLRKAAEAMRNQYAAAIKENMASASTQRTADLQGQQSDFAGRLKTSSDDAQNASRRMDYARNGMADLAKSFAEEAQDSKAPKGVSNRFYDAAAEGLDASETPATN